MFPASASGPPRSAVCSAISTKPTASALSTPRLTQGSTTSTSPPLTAAPSRKPCWARRSKAFHETAISSLPRPANPPRPAASAPPNSTSPHQESAPGLRKACSASASITSTSSISTTSNIKAVHKSRAPLPKAFPHWSPSSKRAALVRWARAPIRSTSGSASSPKPQSTPS